MGNQLTSMCDEECGPSWKTLPPPHCHGENRITDDALFKESSCSVGTQDDDDESVTCSHPPYPSLWKKNQWQQQLEHVSVSDYVGQAGASVRDRTFANSTTTNNNKFSAQPTTARTLGSAAPQDVTTPLVAIVEPKTFQTTASPTALLPPPAPMVHPSKRSLTVPILQPDAAAISSYYHCHPHHGAATTDDRAGSGGHRRPEMPPSPLLPTHRRSQSVPVNKSRRRQFASVQDVVEGATSSGTQDNGGYGDQEDEQQDALYLRKMYDSRTWEMYRRITEARKKQNRSSYSKNGGNVNHPVVAGAPHYDGFASEFMMPEMDSLHSDYFLNSSPRSGHEMMFMFDFD
jgi:hypothetical protein